MYDLRVRFDLEQPPDATQALSPATADRIAAIMQALAAPSRVRILARLAASPCSVGDIVAGVEMEQSAVSHHLRGLRRLEVVSSHRRGRHVFYALRDNHIRALLEDAIGTVSESPQRPRRARSGANPLPISDDLTGKWVTVTYIIAEPCIDVKDKSCIDVCPVDCIHEYDRILVIDPEECIDCGACEPECPVEAIYPEDALPDKWEAFTKINYAYPEGDVINSLVDEYATAHNVQNELPSK